MGEDVLKIQISLIRPVLLSAPGTRRLLSTLFAFLLCSAQPSLFAQPCIIYIPTRTVQNTGNISEYDCVEQTAATDLPPKRYRMSLPLNTPSLLPWPFFDSRPAVPPFRPCVLIVAHGIVVLPHIK